LFPMDVTCFHAHCNNEISSHDLKVQCTCEESQRSSHPPGKEHGMVCADCWQWCMICNPNGERKFQCTSTGVWCSRCPVATPATECKEWFCRQCNDKQLSVGAEPQCAGCLDITDNETDV
jgi:hypothetical protein